MDKDFHLAGNLEIARLAFYDCLGKICFCGCRAKMHRDL